VAARFLAAERLAAAEGEGAGASASPARATANARSSPSVASSRHCSRWRTGDINRPPICCSISASSISIRAAIRSSRDEAAGVNIPFIFLAVVRARNLYKKLCESIGMFAPSEITKP